MSSVAYEINHGKRIDIKICNTNATTITIMYVIKKTNPKSEHIREIKIGTHIVMMNAIITASEMIIQEPPSWHVRKTKLGNSIGAVMKYNMDKQSILSEHILERILRILERALDIPYP